MKTQEAIKSKLKEHDKYIKSLLERKNKSDYEWRVLNNYKNGRKALLWVLSDIENIPDDELGMNVEFQLTNHEQR